MLMTLNHYLMESILNLAQDFFQLAIKIMMVKLPTLLAMRVERTLRLQKWSYSSRETVLDVKNHGMEVAHRLIHYFWILQ